MKPSNKNQACDELIQELCEAGGFVLLRCDKSWGGTYGWKIDGGFGSVMGYKTEKAARVAFIDDAAGSKMGSVMFNMLKKLYKSKKQHVSA